MPSSAAIDSLRGLEAGLNANRQHHYHLGSGQLAPLDAVGCQRPASVWRSSPRPSDVVGDCSTGRLRREGNAMVRLIDATPIPLGKLCDWAKSNGRIRGMKMHVVYDPNSDCPTSVDITDANVNDVEIGRQVTIEAGHDLCLRQGLLPLRLVAEDQ